MSELTCLDALEQTLAVKIKVILKLQTNQYSYTGGLNARFSMSRLICGDLMKHNNEYYTKTFKAQSPSSRWHHKMMWSCMAQLILYF